MSKLLPSLAWSELIARYRVKKRWKKLRFSSNKFLAPSILHVGPPWGSTRHGETGGCIGCQGRGFCVPKAGKSCLRKISFWLPSRYPSFVRLDDEANDFSTLQAQKLCMAAAWRSFSLCYAELDVSLDRKWYPAKNIEAGATFPSVYIRCGNWPWTKVTRTQFCYAMTERKVLVAGSLVWWGRFLQLPLCNSAKTEYK